MQKITRVKLIAIASLTGLMSSCIVVAPSNNDSPESKKIAKNAELAQAKCGKNNIRSVSVNGFECN